MRVAIIGCGKICPTHVESILNAEATIVALCDIDIKKAAKVRENFNLDSKIYDNYKRMIEKEDIDVVHICTPHYLHKEMIIYALERNINVLCEKPVVISYEEIDEVKEALSISKAQLGVCYQNRYNRGTLMAKRILKNQKDIQMKASVLWHRDASYYKSDPWRGKWSTEGGGVLINQAIHTIDLLYYLTGKPTDLQAVTANREHQGIIETEDSAFIHAIANNFKYSLEASTCADKDYPVHIDIVTKKDHIILEPTYINVDDVVDSVEKPKLSSHTKEVWGDGHKKLIKDFYEHIENKKEFPINLDEASVSLKIVLAAYESQGDLIHIK